MFKKIHAGKVIAFPMWKAINIKLVQYIAHIEHTIGNDVACKGLSSAIK